MSMLEHGVTREPDLMLEAAVSLPERNSLRLAAKDVDATALQEALEALHHRQNVPAAAALVFLSVNENGVGSTINSLVLAVLDALGRRKTLFSPPLVLWSERERCARRDTSCFFASLPSIGNDTSWGRILQSLPSSTTSSTSRAELAEGEPTCSHALQA